MMWWGIANTVVTGVATYLIWDAVKLRESLRERIRAAEAFRDEYQNRMRRISKINQQVPQMFPSMQGQPPLMS